ncbi:MAG: sulfate permease [Chromatiales bacterium]|nr:sulfate permease [Chromatiales bacterium]
MDRSFRRKRLPGRDKLFPFMGWIAELRQPATLKADLIAGVTVALVLVPQSMAYAQLAGLPAHIGLYAALLPGMAAALFGSSRHLATGPVAVVSLMTASALQPLAADPAQYLAFAVLLAFLVGAFQLVLGLLRLGVLVNFLSHPVVMGFTNAAAIIIASSQLGKLFGVSVPRGDWHHETLWNTVQAAWESPHGYTLAMSALSLGVMFVLRSRFPRLPSVLVAVLLATVISWYAGFEAAGGKVVGAVPSGLPSLSLPSLDWWTASALFGNAVVIALIGFMEAISIAKALAARSRHRLNPSQELVGQGLANIVAGFFQGYPVSGSFSRSAVNYEAGAATGFSAVVTGLVIAITLLFLTPLLHHLPQATLAAIIIMAVLNLVRIEPIRNAWRVQKHDGVVAVVSFLLTLALAPHLEWGIVSGLVLSLGLFLYRTMRPRVALLARHPDGTLRDAEEHGLQTCDCISLIRFDGPLYFANTGYFEEVVLDREATKPHLRFVILDAEGINEIDATGEEMLHELSKRLNSVGMQLMIARAKSEILAVLDRTGFIEQLGEKHFTLLRTHAVEHAWREIGCDGECCPLAIANPLMESSSEVRCPAIRGAQENLCRRAADVGEIKL